jgi:uncharacterized protein YraI
MFTTKQYRVILSLFIFGFLWFVLALPNHPLHLLAVLSGQRLYAHALDQAAPAVQVRIARSRVNLRSGPGTSYAVVGGANQGEQFGVVGRNAAGDWYKINRTATETAWVSAPLVEVIGDAKQIPVVDNTGSAPPAATPTAQANPAATATPAGAAPAPTPTPTASSAGNLAPGQLSGRLLYSMADTDAKRWELWEYNFGTGANTKIADWRTEADISKDGSQIVYYAWPDEAKEKAGIWIMDSNFANNRLLIEGGAYPSFNPGGDRLVLNGGEDLYIIQSDGKGLRKLTKGEYAAWSPTNTQIAHRACKGGACGIWLIDANSNNADAKSRVTTGGSDGQPAWSPDGARLAYISKEDGNFEIYAINADGSNKVRLTTNPSSDGLPVWSPDGKWIAFRSDRGGAWAIYVMRADGSDVRKVVDAKVLPLWFFEKMDWR